MIPTLRIEKIDQAEYHGRIMDGRELLGEVWQPTIADVIGEAARHFQPAPRAFNVYYGPVSVGTVLREHMIYDAETYAQRLVSLDALLGRHHQE